MVAPIFCVNDEGQVQALGTFVPVRPEGFVMVQADGAALHSDGLPWWLFDMRPQGYLGRANASAHAAGLGLPPNPEHWRDADVVRALLAHGYDAIGNLLIGERARDSFTGKAQHVGSLATYGQASRLLDKGGWVSCMHP